MLDYLSAFQIFAATWVILAIGVGCGYIKMFGEKEIKAIKRLVYLVPFPAMLFREIGNSKPSGSTWITFGHAIVIQIVLHILVLIYSAFTHGTQPLMTRFTIMAIAYCQTDFFYYSYPIAQVLFNDKIIVHATLCCLVQFLVAPFHELLALFFIPNCVESMNNDDLIDMPEQAALEQKEKPQEENDEEEEGGAMPIEDLDQQKQTEEHIDGAGNPESKEEVVDHDESGMPIAQTDSPSSEEAKAEDVPAVEKPPETRRIWTRNQYIIYAFVNQFTICAILGIIWSAIGVSMPKFLSSFVTDLEKAIIAAGLFTTGCSIAFHPFKGVPIVDVVFGCVFHFVIQPLLSIGLSYAFSMDKSVAMYLIYANACPTSIFGATLAHQIGFKTSSVSYSYYWTSVLTLPVFLLWTVIINETKIFT